MNAFNAHLKALVTLVALGLLVIVAGAWGYSKMTSPFPKSAEPALCDRVKVHQGQRVSAPKVTVSVFNASDRVGLAERTLSEFEDQGFGAGKVGNAPKNASVPFAQVWTSHPDNPAVKLVVSRLGPDAHVVDSKISGAGVNVVVGNTFDQLVDGLSSVKVTGKATICSPPTD